MNTKTIGPLMCCLLLLGGCVLAPSRSVGEYPTLAVYPASGQTARQLDRDRYECHNWAVQVTGFDPSRGYPAVYHEPGFAPGSGIVGGALIGTFLGAAVSDPWHAGQGALLGAIAGATVGAIAENQSANTPPPAPSWRDNDNYRRALSACLEGRGYSVR